MAYTDVELIEIAQKVNGIIKQESKSIDEIPIVDNINNISSMPTIQTIGGISKYVRTPLSLLSGEKGDTGDKGEPGDENVIIIDKAFTTIESETMTLPGVTRELLLSTLAGYESGKVLTTNLAALTGIKVFQNISDIITFQYTFITTIQDIMTGRDNIVGYHVSVSSTKTVTVATAEEYIYLSVAEVKKLMDSKADLGADGYVVSEQIPLLLGKQTGVVPVNGTFESSDPILTSAGDATYQIVTMLADVHDPAQHQFLFVSRNDYALNGIRMYIHNTARGNLNISIGGQVLADFFIDTLPKVLDIHLCVSATSGVQLYVNGVKYYDGALSETYLPPNIFRLSRPGFPYKGTLHIARQFNGVLSEEEHKRLWNNADPGVYMLDESLKAKCTGDFHYYGLRPDKWVNLVGGPELRYVPFSGSPAASALSYRKMGDAREITVDTGVFYTDISAVYKQVTVPRGYYVDRIKVMNLNPSALSGVKAINTNSNLLFIYNASLEAKGSMDTLVSAGAATSYDGVPNYGGYYYKSGEATILRFLAVGNSDSGGMRIIITAKYIGI